MFGLRSFRVSSRKPAAKPRCRAGRKRLRPLLRSPTPEDLQLGAFAPLRRQTANGRKAPIGATACSLGSERRRRGDPRYAAPHFPEPRRGDRTGEGREPPWGWSTSDALIPPRGPLHSRVIGVEFLQFSKGNDCMCISTFGEESRWQPPGQAGGMPVVAHRPTPGPAADGTA